MTRPDGAPRASLTLALTALAAAAWLAFARLLMPSLLAAAYQGQGLPILTRLLVSRARPLEYYLTLWQTVSEALLIAVVLHVAIVLTLDRLAARHQPPQPRRGRTAFLLFSLLFLLATAAARAQHDYHAHTKIWQVVLQGTDPWWMIDDFVLNSYGPLFNALALLIPINPLAPKLLFAASYVFFVGWLALVSVRPRGAFGLPAVVLIGAMLNPLAWVEIAWFGHFDGMAGVACVAALHERLRRRDIASGVWLALGILLKYMPVVLLPFLLVETRPPRLRMRLGLTCAIAVALGLALSVLIWGPSTFRPLSSAVVRHAELLSIFAFLQGDWSPVRRILSAAAIDRLATLSLVVSGLSVFAWCWRRSIEPRAAVVAALLTTLLFYKVGFVQYQLMLGAVVLYWLGTAPPEHDPGRHPMLVASFAVYFGWLAVFDIFYALIGGYLQPDGRWTWLPFIVGLPTFFLGAWALITVLRSPRVRESCAPA